MNIAAPIAERTEQDGTSLAERISAAWTRIMKVAPISADSNFFDLGGDSLLAVSLLLEIERETGHKLAITTIYDAPTIETQVALIAGDTGGATNSLLVRLKDGMDARPLFVVHGLGGTVIELAELGRRIRSENSVYAIEARGLDGCTAVLSSIDEMAACYVEEIRTVQPHGRYLLAGYSFGGLVAFEMARILRRDYHSDADLFLIDAYPHPQTWPRWSRFEVGVRRYLDRMRRAATDPLPRFAKLFSRLMVLTGWRFGGMREAVAPALPIARRWPSEAPPGLPLELRLVHEAACVALMGYVPAFHDCAATFLRARTTNVTFPVNPRHLWRDRVSRLEVDTAPGNHLTMIREHSDLVAERISLWIEKGARAEMSP